MALPDVNFTTGPSSLPGASTADVLSYNGCTFSPLFETKVTSNLVKDNAKRTVKLVEHVIVAEGYVTLPAGAPTIGPTMATLYKLLSAQGGTLQYKGRALDIQASGGSDVVWGPVPEMIEFQPLGAGRSAKVSWKVTVRKSPPAVADSGLDIMQLNYETSVSYGDDGYSSLSIRGTLETASPPRFPVNDRTVINTVDGYRNRLEDRILKGIDLGRFTLIKREFNVSRDKRTLEWAVEAEEKPYMDLPPDCTLAHGTYSVKPFSLSGKSTRGLISWSCNLQATYTVAAGRPRKTAWFHFFRLLFLRMQQSKIAPDNDNPPGPKDLVKAKDDSLSFKPWLFDFGIDEGLYKDSKTISFHATWWLICRFSQILLGSGVWRKLPEGGRNQATNLWALSMTGDLIQGNIMGSRSWLPNRIDPQLDLIIDMGSTGV